MGEKDSKRVSFSLTRFLLCEGEEDAAVARAVIRYGKLTNIHVSPNVDVGGVGGNTGFERAFKAIEPLQGFNFVKDVGIILDNDDSPSVSFNKIANLIKTLKTDGSLKRDWGIPSQAGQKSSGDPSVTVWTWPALGAKGCLETLLFDYISSAYSREAACVNQVCRCTAIDSSWPKSKIDKAKVRIFLATMCKKNPAAALATLWRDCPTLIQVTDSRFRDFERFIRGV